MPQPIWPIEVPNSADGLALKFEAISRLLHQTQMAQTVYWEQLLQAEEEGEAEIARAQERERQILNDKRVEANQYVDQLKQEYKSKLDEEKAESESKIKELQDNLQSEQQEKKARAAEMVRAKKDEIVKLLVDSVLNVNIQ